MKISGAISHPPLHQGCDCYIEGRAGEVTPIEGEQIGIQGEELFKSKGDIKIYNDAFVKYSKTKLAYSDMGYIIKKDMPKMNNVLQLWKGGTQGLDQTSLKTLVSRIESKKGLAAWSREVHKIERIEKGITDALKEQYIKLRALQQAKFAQDKVKTIKLYRGTNGKKTGPKMKDEFIALKTKAKSSGKNWMKEGVEIQENSLVGYTQDKKLADTFGKLSGEGGTTKASGVTMVREVNTRDIFVEVDSIFPTAKGAEEAEVILIGGKTKTTLGNMDWE